MRAYRLSKGTSEVRQGGKPGFTLVEVLIVVVILGILAAIAIPQFSNSTRISRENMLHADLRMVREQIQIYRAQHSDVSPGRDPDSGAFDADVFRSQLTMRTNMDGETSETRAGGYDYGPYLSKIPENPLNGLDSVGVLAIGEGAPEAADDSQGWLYIPEETTFWAFCDGTDESGCAYYDY